MKKLITITIVAAALIAASVAADAAWFAQRPAAGVAQGTDIPWGQIVGAGDVTDVYVVSTYGANVTNAASYEGLWASSQAYGEIRSAGKIRVKSGSSSDDAGSTGCLTLFIEGLDSNYVYQSETLTMDGTTLVYSTNSYIDLYSAECATVGSSGSNVGIITILAGTHVVLGHIEANYGRHVRPYFIVPAGKTAAGDNCAAYIYRAWAGMDSVTATNGGLVSIETAKFSSGTTWGAWSILAEIPFGPHNAIAEFVVPFREFAEKDKIRMRTLVDNAGEDTYGGFDIVVDCAQ